MDEYKFKGYTQAELKSVFDHICDPSDWKAPIAVSVPGELVTPVVAAIEFFTATAAEVKMVMTEWEIRYLVSSVGYRMGPAGP